MENAEKFNVEHYSRNSKLSWVDYEQDIFPNICLRNPVRINDYCPCYALGQGGGIHDDVLKITWLQDANCARTSGYDADGYMNWNQAVAWVNTSVYGGYNDWRLPKTVDGLFIWGYDGTTTGGYNITTSETYQFIAPNVGKSL